MKILTIRDGDKGGEVTFIPLQTITGERYSYHLDVESAWIVTEIEPWGAYGVRADVRIMRDTTDLCLAIETRERLARELPDDRLTVDGAETTACRAARYVRDERAADLQAIHEKIDFWDARYPSLAKTARQETSAGEESNDAARWRMHVLAEVLEHRDLLGGLPTKRTFKKHHPDLFEKILKTNGSWEDFLNRYIENHS